MVNTNPCGLKNFRLLWFIGRSSFSIFEMTTFILSVKFTYTIEDEDVDAHIDTHAQSSNLQKFVNDLSECTEHHAYEMHYIKLKKNLLYK